MYTFKKYFYALTLSFLVFVPSAHAQLKNNQISSTTQARPYYGVIMSDGNGLHFPTSSTSPTLSTVNATSTTATSTLYNLSVPGAFAMGSEYFTNFTTYVRSLFSNGSGITITAGSVALATINAGVLGAQTNGVAPTSQATSTLYGNGIGGQVLGWNNTTGGLMFVSTSSGSGVPGGSTSQVQYNGSGSVFAGVATTTHSVSGPFTVTGTIGALVGGTNSTINWTGLATTSQPSSSNLLVSNGGAGVFGVATGTVSAGSSAITVTAGRSAIGGALAIDCTAATASQAGCLGTTDYSTFNGKQAAGFQISTTSGLSVSNLAYFSTVTGTVLGGVATGTVSAGSSAITVTAGRAAIGGALAIDCAGASASQNGCLSSANFLVFNNKVATSASETAGRLAYYTTTSGTPAQIGNVATTTLTSGTGITVSSTGALVGGSNGTVSLATMNAGVLGSVTSGVAPTSQATSTIFGTGTGGQVLGWNNNTGGLAFVSTTSSGASISGGTNAMLAAWTGASTLTATGTPQVTAIIATTTTATSTFQGQVRIGTSTDASGAGNEFELAISNAVSGLGGLLINTWVNVVNAFTIKNSSGATILNIDDSTAVNGPKWGVGSTTPWGTLTSSGNGTDPVLAISSTTNQGLPNFEIDQNGRVIYSGAVPTLSAGTFMGLGNDSGGKIKTASGAGTTLTMTFSKAWTIAPTCLADFATSTASNVAASTTLTTVVFAYASVNNVVFNYNCFGTQ